MAMTTRVSENLRPIEEDDVSGYANHKQPSIDSQNGWAVEATMGSIRARVIYNHLFTALFMCWRRLLDKHAEDLVRLASPQSRITCVAIIRVSHASK